MPCSRSINVTSVIEQEEYEKKKSLRRTLVDLFQSIEVFGNKIFLAVFMGSKVPFLEDEENPMQVIITGKLP